MADRYRPVFEHFKADLLEVENIYASELDQLDPAFRLFIKNNLSALRANQPDTFSFAQTMAEVLETLDSNFTIDKALIVNSIVDFSSFCTGVIAVNATSISHVRNLDFDIPTYMMKLLYVQEIVDSQGRVVV